MSADLILTTLRTYGPWGLLLLVVIFVIVKGEFSFRYPRTRPPRARRKT
jgi:hypothetical protein